MAWSKFTTPVRSEPLALSRNATGALAVNLACAFVLACHRCEARGPVRCKTGSDRHLIDHPPKHQIGRSWSLAKEKTHGHAQDKEENHPQGRGRE